MFNKKSSHKTLISALLKKPLSNHLLYQDCPVTLVFACKTEISVIYTKFHCAVLIKVKIRKLMVFENKVLRRIFGPRRDEVTGEWRRLHNEELNDLYCSLNIVRVIKWRRMRWAGHMARMGKERGCISSWWGNRWERDQWGDLGVDG